MQDFVSEMYPLFLTKNVKKELKLKTFCLFNSNCLKIYTYLKLEKGRVWEIVIKLWTIIFLVAYKAN